MGCMMGFSNDAPESRMNASDSEDTASANSRKPELRRRPNRETRLLHAGARRRPHERPRPSLSAKPCSTSAKSMGLVQ